MDNKNVFVAIALSMSVLLFWGAFFETPKKPIDPKNNQKVEQKSEAGSITPTINQPTIVKNISREDSIKKDKRMLVWYLAGLKWIYENKFRKKKRDS